MVVATRAHQNSAKGGWRSGEVRGGATSPLILRDAGFAASSDMWTDLARAARMSKGARSICSAAFDDRSIRERVAHQHRVVALGAGGKQRHRGFDQLLDAADVFDRRRVELRPGAGAAGALAPAFHRLIDRLDLGLDGGARRQMMQRLAAPAIGGAD